PAQARPAVMACVLAWTWHRATSGAVATPRLLVVDEAHLLLDDPAAADLLAQFARRARKYHLGVDIVTQRLADFLANTAGQPLLALMALGAATSSTPTAAVAGDDAAQVAAAPSWLRPYFIEAARRFVLPPALLAAVADIESGFNPDAVGIPIPGGPAEGMMQF